MYWWRRKHPQHEGRVQGQAPEHVLSIYYGDPTKPSTWAGAGKAALLFALLWLPWQQLTWAANALSGNGRPVRTMFLVATVVSIPMAASTSTSFAGRGPVFHKQAKVVDPAKLARVGLVATDRDWRFGSGATVEGPFEAIIMALAGRPVASDLSGDGVAILLP
jgi:hypothetical protein